MDASREDAHRSAVTRNSEPRSGASLALDQWRGLALLLVLISHGFYFTDHTAGAGRMGVNLFFFISGILVFRSLNSAKAGGWKLLLTFWWRRLKRLFPALVAYLLLMLLLMPLLQNIATGLPDADFKSYVHDLPMAFGYLIDYAEHVPPTMGHLWSLSVEVQFYLLAPLIYLLGKGSRARQSWAYGCILLVAIVYGFVYPLRITSTHLDTIRYRFEIAVWPMMLGFYCEFAKARLMQLRLATIRPIFYLGLVALPLALLVMIVFPNAKLLTICLGTFLIAPCLIAYIFEMPFSGFTGQILTWLGERTYSIYLLQQPLTIARFLPSILQPIGALASLFFGSLWFTCFEKPFLSKSREKQILNIPIASEGVTRQLQTVTTESGTARII
jgi:peptidoglycan/LPS O-acetylase OafA/YrhL